MRNEQEFKIYIENGIASIIYHEHSARCTMQSDAATAAAAAACLVAYTNSSKFVK